MKLFRRRNMIKRARILQNYLRYAQQKRPRFPSPLISHLFPYYFSMDFLTYVLNLETRNNTTTITTTKPAKYAHNRLNLENHTKNLYSLITLFSSIFSFVKLSLVASMLCSMIPFLLTCVGERQKKKNK